MLEHDTTTVTDTIGPSLTYKLQGDILPTENLSSRTQAPQ